MDRGEICVKHDTPAGKPSWKQMAGACGCESLLAVAWEMPAGRFGAFRRLGRAGRGGLKCSGVGKRQPWTPLKIRWLGHVGARGVGSCQGSLERSGADKRQPWTPLKTEGWSMWLRQVLAIAWERLAGAFGAWRWLIIDKINMVSAELLARLEFTLPRAGLRLGAG